MKECEEKMYAAFIIILVLANIFSLNKDSVK